MYYNLACTCFVLANLEVSSLKCNLFVVRGLEAKAQTVPCDYYGPILFGQRNHCWGWTKKVPCWKHSTNCCGYTSTQTNWTDFLLFGQMQIDFFRLWFGLPAAIWVVVLLFANYSPFLESINLRRTILKENGYCVFQGHLKISSWYSCP